MVEIDIEALQYLINTIKQLQEVNVNNEYKIKQILNDYRAEKGENLILQSKNKELYSKLTHERKENERLKETIEGLKNKIEELKND